MAGQAQTVQPATTNDGLFGTYGSQGHGSYGSGQVQSGLGSQQGKTPKPKPQTRPQYPVPVPGMGTSSNK